jgi:hypothetical protein
MKFQIVSKKFRDKTIEALILKMFEYFITINAQREESIRKSKNKEEMKNLLKELCEYVENGLRKKFSENFVVMINDTPNYAVKYDKYYFLALNYLNYSIIIIKVPYICVPGTFMKNLKGEELKALEEFNAEK